MIEQNSDVLYLQNTQILSYADVPNNNHLQNDGPDSEIFQQFLKYKILDEFLAKALYNVYICSIHSGRLRLAKNV